MTKEIQSFRLLALFFPTDSPDDVAKKVHALEYEHFPQVIEQVLNKNKYQLSITRTDNPLTNFIKFSVNAINTYTYFLILILNKLLSSLRKG